MVSSEDLTSLLKFTSLLRRFPDPTADDVDDAFSRFLEGCWLLAPLSRCCFFWISLSSFRDPLPDGDLAVLTGRAAAFFRPPRPLPPLSVCFC